MDMKHVYGINILVFHKKMLIRQKSNDYENVL